VSNEDREPQIEETPSVQEQLDRERPIGTMSKDQIIHELISAQLNMLERQELSRLRHFLLELRTNEYKNNQFRQSGLMDDEGGSFTPAWI
jgi:hypothetical protein